VIAYAVTVAAFWTGVVLLTLLGCRCLDFVTDCVQRRRGYLARTRP
jgi:hypothetical protein